MSAMFIGKESKEDDIQHPPTKRGIIIHVVVRRSWYKCIIAEARKQIVKRIAAAREGL